MGEVDRIRAQRVLARLRAMTSALSGCDASELDEGATFLELGFDSLFLTQLATEFQREYGLKITFRQLFDELPTLRAIADHIDASLPAETPLAPAAGAASPEPAAVAAQSSVAPASSATAGFDTVPPILMTPAQGVVSNIPSVLQGVVAQQLALMQQQIQLLRSLGRPATPVRGAMAGTADPQDAIAVSVPSSGGATVAPNGQTVVDAAASAPPAEKGTSALPKGFGPGGSRDVSALTQGQRDHIARLVARYNARTIGSKLSTQANRLHHADPRTAAGFNRLWKEMVYPIVIERSRGCRLQDIDGNEYIDILNGFGPNFLGHSPPFVSEALRAQIDRGIEVGPQTPLAGEAARLFCDLTGMDRVSWVNTGSEAVQAAIRLSRTYTGRSKIVVFSGDYHGNFDEVLVRATKTANGRRTVPLAPGIPFRAVEDVLVLDYGTDESLDIIRQHAGEIAAVLVEPVQSRRPEFQPREFLHALRTLTADAGIVLVFDEVITGFRIRPGGAQEYYGVEADLATYGKIIGGGMPIGVVAGRARFMDTFDGGQWQYGDDSFPSAGVTFFAGTFVRHPLAIAAAHATLQYLKAQGPALQESVNRRTTRMTDELNGFFEERGVKIRIPHFASQMFIRVQEESELGTLIFYHLRDRGIHVLEGFPSYMTAAHTDEDVDRIVAAFKDSVLEMQADGVLPQPGSTQAAEQSAQPTWRRTLPLTAGQRDLWMASQMGALASCAFNESDAVLINGPLDTVRFANAVTTVLGRQEALRYRFDADGTSQWVDVQATFELPLVDLSGVDEVARGDRLACLLDEQALTPFDLEHGPLVRVRLVRLEPQAHMFLIYCHHIVFDGFSADLLMRQVSEAYAVATHPTATSQTIPYSVYIHRTQGRGGGGASGDIDYWRSIHADASPTLDLPTDRPRPAQRDYSGATVHRDLGTDLASDLHAAAKSLNTTLYVLLLAAFEVLLSRLSSQEDLVLGIPVAGQARQQLETVGYCVNVLPLRSEPGSHKPFEQLVRETQCSLFDAFDHQDSSLGEIVQSLALPRDPGRLPLVEVIFNCSNYFSSLTLDGCTVSTHENARRAIFFDMFFNIVESQGRLVVDWDYSSALFDAETIERWVDHYVALLQGVVRDHEQAVGDLPLMSSEQGAAIAAMWGGT